MLHLSKRLLTEECVDDRISKIEERWPYDL